jgi:hypothetical protein
VTGNGESRTVFLALIGQPLTSYCQTDDQMVTLFLIVFRRFARPYEVLSKLVERYEFVSSRLETDPLLSRFAHMK